MNDDTKKDAPANPLAADAAAVYYSLVSVRNQEVGIVWSRYNIFAVLNLGLAAAVLSRSPGRWALFALSLLGLLLGVAWLQSSYRGKRMLCGRWEGYIIRFEQQLPPGSCIPTMFEDLAVQEKRLKKKGDSPLPENEVPIHFGLENYHLYVPLAFITVWCLVVLAALGNCQRLLT